MRNFIGFMIIGSYFLIVGGIYFIPLFLKLDTKPRIEDIKTVASILGPFVGMVTSYFFTLNQGLKK